MPIQNPNGQHMADLLRDSATQEAAETLRRLETSLEGLSEEEAAERLEVFGPNEVGQEAKHEWLHRLWVAVRNPLVILLTVLSILSYATDDIPGGTMMLIMVLLGVTLRFVQETKANNAAAKLKAMIKVTATVVRGGQIREVPLQQLVPGDIVKLSAGDMIPGDVRLLAAKDLFIIQGTLTGESLPVEKSEARDLRTGVSSIEHTNICFLGTSVESGAATAVIVATGPQTYFGKMASSLAGQQVETAFDKGVKKFVWLMLSFMLVMVPMVFFINGLMKHNWKDAFFFAMAVAVGLTPEMLPMIVSVCLSKGALAMSKKKVIVKKLNSIQNFGAMDVLCTDKTGTLTIDHVILELHVDVFKNESETVLRDAYLISHFQTGLKNVLDRAVLKYKQLHGELGIDKYKMVDEIPFDFSRRMMSVAIECPNGDRQLLTKGAPEAVFAKCAFFENDGEILPMEPILVGDLVQQVNDLSEDGFRVLAVATKKLGAQQTTFSKSDENDLVLAGYLAFLDPPKDSAAKAITALRQNGVTVKVLTGDNDLVTRKVCTEVGIHAEKILLGSQVEKLTDEELGREIETTDVFARLSPAHKKRVVQALQRNKHVVGFMGDGINDAPALRAADVGISVDTAVDIAKESADMILLEKDLMVLEEGVLEGRKVFVNILKYIRMGASSNFGNMFSVLGASAWLKFLPMQPIQVLTNNLLYDFSQVPIPTDNVGTAVISKPRPWNMGEIGKFILFIGPISSIFDYTTYALMWFYFKCNNLLLAAPPELAARFANPADSDHTYAASLFSTGWFVESLMTQTLIVHVIRTNQIPFIQSRASWQLTLTTFAIMGVGALLPFSPLARYLGFVPLPWQFWPLLAATLVCYVGLTQVIKSWLVRRNWI
jgi:Mg2+-importing ATPase